MNVNDFPEYLRKRMETVKDMEWKSVYLQEPLEHKGKPYRCISPGLDIKVGAIIDLKLSSTLDERILAKSSYRNWFKKTYKNYDEFLKEWEAVE